MITNTNKMFSNRILREMLRNMNMLNNKYIHKITFKKPKVGVKYNKGQDYGYQIFTHKNNIIIYIKPYTILRQATDFWRYYRPFSKNTKLIIYYNELYNSIYLEIRSVLSNAERFIGLIKGEILELKINYKQYKIPFRTDVYKDFWSLLNFTRKDFRRRWKNKNNSFSYECARFLRILRSNWSGIATINELQSIVLKNTNIISNYKLKKELLKVAPPVVFKSKFKENAKSFVFYTIKHVKYLEKKYKKQIDKVEKFLKQYEDKPTNQFEYMGEWEW